MPIAVYWHVSPLATAAAASVYLLDNESFSVIEAAVKFGRERPEKHLRTPRRSTNAVIILATKAREYVFTGVGLCVCLSVCL